jgi:hypothetical protein
MPTVNKELIRKIRPIVEKQELWQQGAWRTIVAFDDNGKPENLEDALYPVAVDEENLVFVQDKLVAIAEPRCKSAMCVSGWAVELDPRATWALDVPHAALRQLGYLRGPNIATYQLPQDHETVIKDDQVWTEVNRRAYPRSSVCYSGERIEVFSAREVGAVLLGLDEDVSNWLFDSQRQQDEILAFFDLVLADQLDFEASIGRQVERFIEANTPADAK